MRYLSGVNRFGATLFENQVKDLIAINSTFTTVTNIAQARIRGVELSGATELAGVKIKASYNWQDPEDRATGKTLTYRAQRHGTLDLAKSFGGLELGAQVIASDKRYVNAANTQTISGYALVNLRARYQVAADWRVLARVNNLLDQDYQLVNGYNTPGINAFVGVEYNPR